MTSVNNEKVGIYAHGIHELSLALAKDMDITPYETICGLVQALARISAMLAQEGMKRDAIVQAAEQLLFFAGKDSPILRDEPPAVDH